MLKCYSIWNKCKPYKSLLNIQVQSNLTYPASPYPDLSVIQTWALGDFLHMCEPFAHVYMYACYLHMHLPLGRQLHVLHIDGLEACRELTRDRNRAVWFWFEHWMILSPKYHLLYLAKSLIRMSPGPEVAGREGLDCISFTAENSVWVSYSENFTCKRPFE